MKDQSIFSYEDIKLIRLSNFYERILYEIRNKINNELDLENILKIIKEWKILKCSQNRVKRLLLNILTFRFEGIRYS